VTSHAAPIVLLLFLMSSLALTGPAGCGSSSGTTQSASPADAGGAVLDAAGASNDGAAGHPADARPGDAHATGDVGGDVTDGPVSTAPDAGADGGASPRQRLLQFITSISGHQTMSGEHNREASEGDFIQAMNSVTGHYPALWGGDFLYESDSIQNRPSMIQYEMNGWNGGAVISLMYHACPPTQAESCGWDGGVLSTLTDAQWSDLVTDGGTLNQIWKARLDAIAPYFQQLEDAGMAALFRPQHEMNQGAFWWGGRPGPGGTAKLFQITHDYLTNTKGLDNIVWVWSVQDIWNSQDSSWDFDAYNPGGAYWDVMSLDFYDGNGYTADKYAAVLAEAGSKPIAIGECEVLPTAAELTAQPRWVYFMGWAELVQQNDSNAAITAVYTAPNVLTRDRMPGW
jgi:mannan endo-1,4-beta-mannosidase